MNLNYLETRNVCWNGPATYHRHRDSADLSVERPACCRETVAATCRTTRVNLSVPAAVKATTS